MRSRWWAAGLLLLWPEPAVAAGVAPAGPELVSVSSTGVQADADGSDPSISADGRFVAFATAATNLGGTPGGGAIQVHVRDRLLGTTTRPVRTLDGTAPEEGATEPALSDDGRFLAFTSAAPDLVPGDTNDMNDVFVQDLSTGTVTRVSVATGGAEANSHSAAPDLTADGRYVAFASRGSNLLPGRDVNGPRLSDVFVHDRSSGTTRLVSESLTGQGGNRISRTPRISADGRYVAFISFAVDLVPDGAQAYGLFVRDFDLRVTTRESVTHAGAPATDIYTASMSRDGRFVTFETDMPGVVPDDLDTTVDAFVRDRSTGEVERVSVAAGGATADDGSWHPVVADGGRCVIFSSAATNLTPGAAGNRSDVFARDRATGTTTRLTGGGAGAGTDGGSWMPRVSADGRYAAFESSADDLVPGDTNGHSDVFVAGTGCGATITPA